MRELCFRLHLNDKLPGAPQPPDAGAEEPGGGGEEDERA